MKTMTCKQLGGACDIEFHADTFEEIADLSRIHGSQMFQKGDEAHLKAMEEMKSLMSTPSGLTKWMDQKRREFNSLQED